MKIVGTSQVSSKLRVTVIKRAAEKLGLKDGDTLVFYEDEKGQIVIKKT